jgi:hypothetical protein
MPIHILANRVRQSRADRRHALETRIIGWSARRSSFLQFVVAPAPLPHVPCEAEASTSEAVWAAEYISELIEGMPPPTEAWIRIHADGHT